MFMYLRASAARAWRAGDSSCTLCGADWMPRSDAARSHAAGTPARLASVASSRNMTLADATASCMYDTVCLQVSVLALQDLRF